jgi:hypothetical protein
MSTKKGTQTAKGRASKKEVSAGARGYRPVTFTITLDTPPEASDADLKHWREAGEIYSRLLSHADCPNEFKKAFGVIFTEELFDKSNLNDPTDPQLLRAFFPMVMVDLAANIPATAEGLETALLRLSETLVPATLKERILAEVKGGAR